MSIGHLYVLFGEVSIQALCPFLIRLFVFLVLSCISSLYILYINPLSDLSLANIFFHTVSEESRNIIRTIPSRVPRFDYIAVKLAGYDKLASDTQE